MTRLMLGPLPPMLARCSAAACQVVVFGGGPCVSHDSMPVRPRWLRRHQAVQVVELISPGYPAPLALPRASA